MKKALMTLATAAAAAAMVVAPATSASATGAGSFSKCSGQFWSYISGSNVHSESYKNGATTCTLYKARARAHNVYSSWDTGTTEAYASLTKDPTSNGGTHQACTSGSSCQTRYS